MKLLITCSGLSNNGRLTTQVATILISRHPDDYIWLKASTDPENISKAAIDADLIIIIEGCSDRCASKKIIDLGVKGDFLLVATELGIEKNGMAEVQWSDVEKMRVAVKQQLAGV